MANEIDPRLLAQLASRRRFIGVVRRRPRPWSWARRSWPRVASPTTPRAVPAAGGTVGRRQAGHRQAADLQLAAVHGRRLHRGVPDGDRPDGRLQEDYNDNEGGSPRTRSCRASRTSAPTWWCPPSSWRPASTGSAGSTASAKPGGPTKKNMRADLLDAKADPGRKFSAPYMSGMTALAYNRAATGRDITKIEDLWDPGLQGQDQPAGRHPGRARHDHAVAGRVGGEPDHGVRAEGRRPDQGAEGQGPDPALHRQRLRRRPGVRQCGYRPGVFGRRGAAAEGQPGPEVRGSRDRRHDVRRHMVIPYTTQNQKAAEGGSTTSTTGRTTPSSSRTPSTCRCSRTCPTS